MAIIYHADGFKHYTSTADALLKGYTAFSGTIISNIGADGGPGYRTGNNNNFTTWPLITPISTIGAIFRAKASFNSHLIKFCTAAGVTEQCDVRVTADGHLTLTRNGTLLCTSNGIHVFAGVYTHFEVLAVIAGGTSGSVNVKANGQLITWNDTPSNHNACNTANSGTTVDTVVIRPNNVNIDYSDYVIADDFIGNAVVETSLPASPSGANSDWFNSTGDHTNNYSYVDDVTPNTTDFVRGAVAGDVDTYNFQNLAAIPGTPVLAVIHRKYMKQDIGGTAPIVRSIIRHGATEATGTTDALTTSYKYYSQIFQTNPANASADWTVDDFNAIEIGQEAVTIGP